jgi:hypothetical protein
LGIFEKAFEGNSGSIVDLFAFALRIFSQENFSQENFL